MRREQPGEHESARPSADGAADKRGLDKVGSRASFQQLGLRHKPVLISQGAGLTERIRLGKPSRQPSGTEEAGRGLAVQTSYGRRLDIASAVVQKRNRRLELKLEESRDSSSKSSRS